MCKINRITVEGPNADELRDAIAAALAKQKNTLAIRDEHEAATLEAIPAPIKVAVIIANPKTEQQASQQKCATNIS